MLLTDPPDHTRLRALTRLEGRVAISTLLDRFPHLRLAGDRVEWRPIYATRALKALPVHLA